MGGPRPNPPTASTQGTQGTSGAPCEWTYTSQGEPHSSLSTRPTPTRADKMPTPKAKVQCFRTASSGQFYDSPHHSQVYKSTLTSPLDGHPPTILQFMSVGICIRCPLTHQQRHRFLPTVGPLDSRRSLRKIFEHPM